MVLLERSWKQPKNKYPIPAQVLKENMFQAPKTKENQYSITWIEHFHTGEETVEDGKKCAHSHYPLHLSFPILVLKYSTLSIFLKHEFISFLGILHHFELGIGCKGAGGEGEDSSWEGGAE